MKQTTRKRPVVKKKPKVTKRKNTTSAKKKPKRRKFGDFISDESDSDYEPSQSSTSKQQSQEPLQVPQLNLLLKTQQTYKKRRHIPFEILVKIFNHVIQISDDPLRDICSLARVCESWRKIILSTSCLWSRIELSKIPVTAGNITTIQRVFKLNPNIIPVINSVSLNGRVDLPLEKYNFICDTLISAPNLNRIGLYKFSTKNAASFTKNLSNCPNLTHLVTIDCPQLYSTSQRWIADLLAERGSRLDTLDLNMSLNVISSRLFRSMMADMCPKLRVLDLSTYDCLQTRSFDATALAANMPCLEVLRCANVSFKRVHEVQQPYGLPRLVELSIPNGARDVDRDDALFSTLAYGSENIKRLDLRGTTISFNALLNMPSCDVTDLHIDDTCPALRAFYCKFFERWSHSLENVSLVRINCSDTIHSCLKQLFSSSNGKEVVKLRKLDLSGSDVSIETMRLVMKRCSKLESVDLSACRSLPRGCKGTYTMNPLDDTTKNITNLIAKLRRG